MQRQVVLIHGGHTYTSYEGYLADLEKLEIPFEQLTGLGSANWTKRLPEDLGEEFLLLTPRMPNSQNAKYLEWKIWFEKLIPHLTDGVVLIGNSLGGIFLVKYLSEHEFPKEIAATLLIAAPYKDESIGSLGDFTAPENLSRFAAQGGKIFFYYSEDDPVVPFAELAMYRARLPEAIVRTFTGRGHFYKEETFPEIVADIQSLS